LKLTQLREVRELHGWSQSKLAEESGVSRDGISNYETGHREAWPATAKKLADALQAEISDLVARVEEPALAGKVEAPREAGRPDEERSAHDIARCEARRQFEIDTKALRRTIASEGTDRAARVSDVHEPGVYDALKRRPPGELAGTLLDAERHVAYLEQENADLREALAQTQAALGERGQGAQEPADVVHSTHD